MGSIIIISGILAIAQSILFWDKKPGISVFIFVFACLLYLIYVLNKNKKIENKKALILVIPILLLSSTYFIFNNALFNVLNTVVITVLGIIMCVYACKKKLNTPKFIRKCKDVFLGMLVHISDLLDCFKTKKEREENESLEKVKKVIKALFISLPIILVVLALLMSADEIFQEIFDDVFINIGELLTGEGIIKFLSRMSFILITFLLCGGLIINLVKSDTLFNGEDEETKKREIKFENLTINMILTILNIIYLIFSFIQISNLFMHTSNNLNFDYASYARQGFFQLMFVSFINFVILIIANVNKQEKTKSQKIYNKIMSLLIMVFTIIIIISAFYRMNLYIETYGYTYLRIFVQFILITEILISIPIMIKLLGAKIDLVKTSIVITCFMYLILNFMNINNFIARENIDKYLENKDDIHFDLSYLQKLGTDAIPQITRLLKVENENIKERAENYLLGQRNTLKIFTMSWQEYNISKKQAIDILNELNLQSNTLTLDR